MYENKTMCILKKADGAKYFIRENGRISSLLTVECLFNREQAWAVSREWRELYGEVGVIVFRTVGTNLGYIGKTPEEILTIKKEALLSFCGNKKIKRERSVKNETKKKKTSAQVEQDSLFSSMG